MARAALARAIPIPGKTMHLSLRANLHYCVANGRVVCLDLARDRYFALPDDLDATFQAFAKGTDIACLSPVDITRLREQDLLVETSSSEPFPSPPHLECPSTSYLDTARGLISPFTFLSALWVQRRARFNTPPLDLATEVLALSQLKRCKAHIRRTTEVPKTAAQALRAYLATRRLVATRDQCLFQSVTLLRFLIRFGWSPKLVIGVRMAPFAAHAWLQSGETVLNDRLDHVRPYTPILVI